MGFAGRLRRYVLLGLLGGLLMGAAQTAGAVSRGIIESSVTYNNSAVNSDDCACDVAVDRSGNIIVTGYSYNAANADYFTIKYDPGLNVIASARSNGAANNEDYVYAVAVDSSGNIIVTGQSRNSTDYDFLTIKYDPNLNLLSSATYNKGAGKNDRAHDVAVDSEGNIIVVGDTPRGADADFLTIKYDPGLHVISSATFNAANYSDAAYSVAVDTIGNIIVGGASRTAGGDDVYSDCLIIKYDPYLNVLASATYSGPDNNYDVILDIAVDVCGNIIASGYSSMTVGGFNYLTLKYDSYLNLISSAVFDRAVSDQSAGMAVDASGNIIVTGTSTDGGGKRVFCTVIYDPDLAVISTATYGGSASNLDEGNGVAVEASGNIIVTGNTYSTAQKRDYLTLRYNRLPPVISSLTPASAERGKTLDLTVSGSNFLEDARAAVSAAGMTVNSTAFSGRTQVRLNVTISPDAPAGTRDAAVTVTNADDTTATRTFAFEVIVPTVTPSDTTTAGGRAGPDDAAEIKIRPASGEIKVGIAAGTFSQAVNVTVSTAVAPGSSRPTIKVGAVCLEITNDLNLQPGKPVTITVNYRDADIAGLDESKLLLCRYDAAHDLWIPLPTTVDAANNVLTAVTDHLSTFVLVQLAPAADLAGVTAFPNPFDPRRENLTLANLTGEAEIRIYNLAGELVRTLAYNSANGRTSWDGKNDGGSVVASGVYLALVKSGADKKIVKIAVEK